MFLPKKTNWKQDLPTSFLTAATADGTAKIGQSPARSSARRSFIRSAAARSPLAVASFAAAAANSRRNLTPTRSLLGRNFTAGALGRSLMNFSFNSHSDKESTVNGLMNSTSTRLPYIYDRNMLRAGSFNMFQTEWLETEPVLTEARKEEIENNSVGSFAASFMPAAATLTAPALTFFEEIKNDAVSIKNSVASSFSRAQEVCRKIWSHGGPVPEKINLPVLANNQ